MTERETLDPIIKDSVAALPSEKASIRDRSLLNLQIPIRKARIADLMQQRDTLK